MAFSALSLPLPFITEKRRDTSSRVTRRSAKRRASVKWFSFWRMLKLANNFRESEIACKQSYPTNQSYHTLLFHLCFMSLFSLLCFLFMFRLTGTQGRPCWNFSVRSWSLRCFPVHFQSMPTMTYLVSRDNLHWYHFLMPSFICFPLF